jgi:D-alanyl-lipoteichoic acid acyltransferase DltB (MBOAT superfamily)
MGFLRGLVIPVGISFYTFQKVGFAIDTLHFRKPLPRFLEYLNFVAFFPQIVAGPIERRQNLLPQMEAFRFRWLPKSIDEGIGWIVLGLFFKCCLADNLALHFDASSQTNAYRIWLANVVFGLRIYYDFAGYSLVAVGLGRCLGINLTLNFTSPLCATSATEFWHRWHITLSQWFRDYLYIPLGGNRARCWSLLVALVFVVSGIWHGAGWNFVLWGALHGGFLIVNRKLGPLVRLPAFLAWLLTTLATYLAWLCFYELRTAVLFTKLGTLFHPTAYGMSALREAVAYLQSADSLVLVCTLVLAAFVLILEWRSLAAKNEPYALLRRPKILAALVILTVILAPDKHNAFIYFAF